MKSKFLQCNNCSFGNDNDGINVDCIYSDICKAFSAIDNQIGNVMELIETIIEKSLQKYNDKHEDDLIGKSFYEGCINTAKEIEHAIRREYYDSKLRTSK